MPRWLEDLEAAMAAADGQDARIAAFVSTQLRLVAHGSHRMAELLGDAPLGPAVRARINALAYRPAALLEPELGPHDPKLVAQLVQGVVNAGVRLLHGAGHAGAGRAADRHARADARPLAHAVNPRSDSPSDRSSGEAARKDRL